MNINEAKTILNKKNKNPYTEQEITEILKILGSFSEIIFENLTQKGTL